MPATLESQSRTFAFARVIGPWLLIVPAIIIARLPDMAPLATAFFANSALVWFAGALLLFSGLLIIAVHRSWRGSSAVLISLFGWFLGLRGLALMIAPGLFQRGAEVSIGSPLMVRALFAVLMLIGAWLTYDSWVAHRSAPTHA